MLRPDSPTSGDSSLGDGRNEDVSANSRRRNSGRSRNSMGNSSRHNRQAGAGRRSRVNSSRSNKHVDAGRITDRARMPPTPQADRSVSGLVHRICAIRRLGHLLTAPRPRTTLIARSESTSVAFASFHLQVDFTLEMACSLPILSLLDSGQREGGRWPSRTAVVVFSHHRSRNRCVRCEVRGVRCEESGRLYLGSPPLLNGSSDSSFERLTKSNCGFCRGRFAPLQERSSALGSWNRLPSSRRTAVSFPPLTQLVSRARSPGAS